MLVLIPKGPVKIPEEIKARPICLLDEIGKTFERIIAYRINRWLEDNEDCSLSSNQYGFRRARSTVDALFRVRELTRIAVDGNGFAIAVGLDIVNAFNSIPWSVILDAMEQKRIPGYLRRIVAGYLSCRSIAYKNNRGRVVEREVQAGVPQGSVLGPLLWNIAFDSVLRLSSEDGCHTVCYADDILVLSTSDRLFDAIVKANIQIARVTRQIGKLGLKVADTKTEAVLFCKKKPSNMPMVRVGTANIQVTDSMKYLGVMVDGSWNFRSHFRYIEAKASRVVRALSRLMPNLRGPGERKRQLFANVLTSVVMYASPVWAEAFSSAPDRVTRPLRRLQRTIAIRTIASYRTVSYDAATLLARNPPWQLEATMRSRIYSRIVDLRARNEYTPQTDAEVRDGENLLLIRQWHISLDRPEI